MRAGRTLELLVARLEGLFGPLADVKSPDFFPDRVTGQQREVDVSVTMELGSELTVVVFECRDRRDRQDVTWIEQLATKARDIEVDRVVAVSSSGFSEPAVTKAAF